MVTVVMLAMQSNLEKLKHKEHTRSVVATLDKQLPSR